MLFVLAGSALLVAPFRLIDPPTSAFMLRDVHAGVDVRYQWVDFEAIGPALPIGDSFSGSALSGEYRRTRESVGGRGS